MGSDLNTMKTLLVWLLPILLFLPPALFAQEKQMALTFDKLPFMQPLGFWRPREVSRTILEVLNRHEIQAMGFVVEEKLAEDPGGNVVLLDWVERGQRLGNHGYAYADLHQLSVRDFLMHIRDGETSLRRAARVGRFKYRYFRFPLLHQGDTKDKKKKVAKALYRDDYTVVPVTVKTTDYLFNQAYVQYWQDSDRLDQLKRIYLQHVSKSLDYAENQSQQLFGRVIPQILWLHCGIGTATFLEDLVQLLLKRGYRFVLVLEALKDPAYQTEEDYVGPLGLSFLDRVAATRGLPFEPEHGELSETQLEDALEKGSLPVAEIAPAAVPAN